MLQVIGEGAWGAVLLGNKDGGTYVVKRIRVALIGRSGRQQHALLNSTAMQLQKPVDAIKELVFQHTASTSCPDVMLPLDSWAFEHISVNKKTVLCISMVMPDGGLSWDKVKLKLLELAQVAAPSWASSTALLSCMCTCTSQHCHNGYVYTDEPESQAVLVLYLMMFTLTTMACQSRSMAAA